LNLLCARLRKIGVLDMDIKFILKVVIFFIFVNVIPLFGEEVLNLPAIEGSHSVGKDQNSLGINAYNKKLFNQALRHFQIASVVDRKRGEIFYNLGLTLHQLGKHLEAARHFQWAVKLSPNNKKISESKLFVEYNCDNNSKIPCNLTKPKKHKIEGSDTNSTPNYMPSYSGSGY
jgi:tetratricopeptide (TPR) repeat protein